MDESRKKVITNEILYWKANRMLPEHYCDFLLNLYNEGESKTPEHEAPRNQKSSKLFGIIFVSMFFLSVFFFYFTELSFSLQMTLSIFLVISSFFLLVYSILNTRFSLIFLLAAAFLFLLNTVNVSVKLFPGSTLILYSVTFFNCILWLIIGMKKRFQPFLLSGIAGIAILIITIFI